MMRHVDMIFNVFLDVLSCNIYIHSWLQLRRNSFGGDNKGAFGLGFTFSRYRRCNHLTPEMTTCSRSMEKKNQEKSYEHQHSDIADYFDHIVVHMLNNYIRSMYLCTYVSMYGCRHVCNIM